MQNKYLLRLKDSMKLSKLLSCLNKCKQDIPEFLYLEFLFISNPLPELISKGQHKMIIDDMNLLGLIQPFALYFFILLFFIVRKYLFRKEDVLQSEIMVNVLFIAEVDLL